MIPNPMVFRSNLKTMSKTDTNHLESEWLHLSLVLFFNTLKQFKSCRTQNIAVDGLSFLKPYCL